MTDLPDSTESKSLDRADPPASTLLALDLGLRMGLARFGLDGRLREYRSHNLGHVGRLKRAAPQILADSDVFLFAEGDRSLFDVWDREAGRRGIEARLIPAETWRRDLLWARQRRRGREAKRAADRMARRVIEWSAAPRPTSLRHDAAEAILLGLWAVLDVGWLARIPDSIQPGR